MPLAPVAEGALQVERRFASDVEDEGRFVEQVALVCEPGLACCSGSS